ncbi:MAG: COX15/CtaA family protein [Microbacteriaceae bacterium]
MTSRAVVVVTWLNLIAQIGIVGTGGLVRLTASGLGCPTWPTCTEDSLVTTPEMGIHGVIEFGNRLLTFVLLAVCIAQLVVLWNLRKTRRTDWRIAIALVAGIPVQAVIGGVSVWMQLNPYVVGLHFFASAIMVALAATLLFRITTTEGLLPRIRAVSALSWAIAAMTTVVLIVGVLTTGSGPHAGDADAPRNRLDPELLQHVHAWPAYVTVVLIALAWWTAGSIERRAWFTVLGGFGVQIAIGIWQSRTGLPIELVAIHLTLSMVVLAFVTRGIYVRTMSGSSATATKSTVK